MKRLKCTYYNSSARNKNDCYHIIFVSKTHFKQVFSFYFLIVLCHTADTGQTAKKADPKGRPMGALLPCCWHKNVAPFWRFSLLPALCGPFGPRPSPSPSALGRAGSAGLRHGQPGLHGRETPPYDSSTIRGGSDNIWAYRTPKYGF